MNNLQFLALLRDKGHELYRPMPWRDDTRPYYVLVSEIMLQQTQVVRVLPKFQAFIAVYPDMTTLAQASLADVLKRWQGLGYNRRAKYLHEAAKMIVHQYDGQFPSTEAELLTLPGVGKNTAGALLAYSFNKPAIFIETNIRTVYIHHFFADDFAVDDRLIRQKLEATIDRQHPREFYWALMDYGAWLKARGIKNIAQSKHYTKQTPLKGSVREVRGQIITELHKASGLPDAALRIAVKSDDRYEIALAGLVRDGLVTKTKSIIHLTK